MICILEWRRAVICILARRRALTCILARRRAVICILEWRHALVCILEWRLAGTSRRAGSAPRTISTSRMAMRDGGAAAGTPTMQSLFVFAVRRVWRCSAHARTLTVRLVVRGTAPAPIGLWTQPSLVPTALTQRRVRLSPDAVRISAALVSSSKVSHKSLWLLTQSRSVAYSTVHIVLMTGRRARTETQGVYTVL